MQEFWLPILSFTLFQSFCSAFLSVCLGGLLARFLWRRPSLYFQKTLYLLGGLIFVMPIMVPSLGFLILFEGVYGGSAIITLHVFINTIYCMAQIHKGYLSFIDTPNEKQAFLLRLTLWERFIYLELPAVQSTLYHLFMVVFCFSLSSFSVILLLGGGPATTTLSVALYHSLSVSFDLSSAFFFLVLQILLSCLFAFFLHRTERGKPRGMTRERSLERKKKRGRGGDLFCVALILLFLLPIGVILKETVVYSEFLKALALPLLNTLFMGLFSSVLTLSFCLIFLAKKLQNGKSFNPSLSIIISVLLSIPKIVLVGFVFLLLHSFLGTKFFTYSLIILLNIFSYSPFVLKSFLADFKGLQERYGGQIYLLRLQWRDIISLLTWPCLHKKIRESFLMVCCFSMGNLSIPLLLGQFDIQTLPVLAYQALLSYDQEKASFYMGCLLMLMLALYGISFLLQRIKKGKVYA